MRKCAMKFNDLGLDEADILGNDALRPSIDPAPGRQMVNIKVMKSMVDDYMSELKAINRNLHVTPEIIASLAQLEDLYNRMFGHKLVELGSTEQE